MITAIVIMAIALLVCIGVALINGANKRRETRMRQMMLAAMIASPLGQAQIKKIKERYRD